ncbi:hypothetical protein [Tengunoibacter tsumagoiensis]|uniref:Glycosyltransferase RgtA/B/C/D-like domain-containing protein n=1 Tax=Tengunoibacter tsumagoiensis TaxID=2014871 RepID=A0A402A1Q6_9CHLR|nr:hypothetical protein [Tengunoibacter tsumagoiensis]GCE13088.1 hypothetical protein KTT_29470 [Tengunoibacter tsumagoiensis]
MALEARHIAFTHDHPVYLYGQNYMGAGEAYLGAIMFHLFGPSIFALRLGMLLLFLCALICCYLLARLVYGRKIALITLLLTIGGSGIIFAPELMAVGGAMETVLCGSLTFLLSSWLALHPAYLSNTGKEKTVSHTIRYGLLYGTWGLAVGLGLWSHLLVVPFILCSILILLIFCLPDLCSYLVFILGFGLLIGITPLIIYNMLAPFKDNSIAVFLGLHNTAYPDAPHGLSLWLKQLSGTLFDSLPMATGMPSLLNLDVRILPFYGPLTHESLIPIVFYGGWSSIYLTLLLIETRRSWPGKTLLFFLKKKSQQIDPEKRAAIIKQILRFFLALCVWLTLLSYASSATAAERPWSFRYLIGLLVTIPVVINPLCSRLFLLKKFTRDGRASLQRLLQTAIFTLMITLVIYGSIQSLQAIPEGNIRIQQQADLITFLHSRHISKIYSGYWVCDSLIFQSEEKIICAVLDDHLDPGLTRYSPYKNRVDSSRDHIVYIFTKDGDYHPDAAIKLLTQSGNYQKFESGAYMIFQAKR